MFWLVGVCLFFFLWLLYLFGLLWFKPLCHASRRHQKQVKNTHRSDLQKKDNARANLRFRLHIANTCLENIYAKAIYAQCYLYPSTTPKQWDLNVVSSTTKSLFFSWASLPATRPHQHKQHALQKARHKLNDRNHVQRVLICTPRRAHNLTTKSSETTIFATQKWGGQIINSHVDKLRHLEQG